MGKRRVKTMPAPGAAIEPAKVDHDAALALTQMLQYIHTLAASVSQPSASTILRDPVMGSHGRGNGAHVTGPTNSVMAIGSRVPSAPADHDVDAKSCSVKPSSGLPSTIPCVARQAAALPPAIASASAGDEPSGAIAALVRSSNVAVSEMDAYQGIEDDDDDEYAEESSGAAFHGSSLLSLTNNGSRRSKRLRCRVAEFVAAVQGVDGAVDDAAPAELALSPIRLPSRMQLPPPSSTDTAGLASSDHSQWADGGKRSRSTTAAGRQAGSRGSYTCRFAACGKSFVQATPRNDHEAVVHLAILPYLCLVCNKAFPSKRNLNRHGAGVHRTHTGSLPFRILPTADLRTAALEAEAAEATSQEADAARGAAASQCDTT